MNNQQHSFRGGIYASCADGMPSLLRGPFVDALRVDQAALVVKDQRRKFKRDSTMFSLVT
jgi:hypothetical protein